MAILGVARSGASLAAALRERRIEVCAADDRPESEISSAGELRELGAELSFGGSRSGVLERAELLAVSPGVPLTHPIVVEATRRHIPVRSEVEIAWRILQEESEGPNRYVAVTGTNGKSTVATWTAALLGRGGLPVALAGNIGVPLSDFCVRRDRRDFVVEMSSFQLETIDQFRPDVAVVTNITPDHIDRHGSLSAYAAAKARVFENQRDGDRAVLNTDDPGSAILRPPARRISFSTEREISGGVFVRRGAVVSDVDGASGEIVPVSRLALPGLHNLENALASAAAAICLGVALPAVAAGLSDFAGLPHRTETVATMAGVSWIDDSKGTNPDAVVKSLAGFRDRSVILILGGSEKGSDFSLLRQPVARAARVALTIGSTASRIEEALSGLDVRRAGDMASAVRMAASLARPGEAVLLSPACASFDQYRNFEERGRHFAELVRDLPEASRGA